jgi:hypothetical protein
MEDTSKNKDRDFVELLDRIKNTPIKELIEQSGFDGTVEHGQFDEKIGIVDRFSNNWQPADSTRERIKNLLVSEIYKDSSETTKKIINSIEANRLMDEKNDYLEAKDNKMNIGESLLLGDSMIEKLNKVLEKINNSESQDNE